MNDINNSILTLILLVPLGGAVLVALAPDRAKLPNWLALLTALATFGLTLHLPFHYDLERAGFQFVEGAPKPAQWPEITADDVALLLFVIVPWTTVLADFGIHLNMAGH